MNTRLVLLALLVMTAGCSPFHSYPVPSPVSAPPTGDGRFLAGAATVDITPPIGLGMAGSGPEGRIATGARIRLYVRALALQDATGERVVFAVADLGFVSASLQRLVAQKVFARHGLGADRLILSATHTHSGPGNYFGERSYNINAARLSGYDPRIMYQLVDSITSAVSQALTTMHQAGLSWDTAQLSEFTENRSLPAQCNNATIPGGRQCSLTTVDQTMTMLRIDTLRSPNTRGLFASYTAFAIHPTAIPSVNTRYDSDIPGRVVERFQQDTRAGNLSPPTHLLANGAEGDVTPKMTRPDDCEVPRVGPAPEMTMPRGFGPRADFREPPKAASERCIAAGVEAADRIATGIASAAGELYQRLGTKDPAAPRIRRAFTTITLPGNDGLCGHALIGAAAAAGAEPLVTRVRGWDWVVWPLLRMGMEEGGGAVQRPDGCHGTKRPLVKPIQKRLLVGEHGFPEVAQLAVVQIGSLLLVAVPAEVTSVTWWRIEERLLAMTRSAGVEHVALIGLANGYLQYVATKEEYALQHYEGGSTLYGPEMAGFLERRLVELVEGMLRNPADAPQVLPLMAHPGPDQELAIPAASVNRTPR